MNVDSRLVVWPSDWAPSVDCDACGNPLLSGSGEHGPLPFTLRKLAAAVSAHDCPAGRQLP